MRDDEDGLAVALTGYTVENAVNDWLMFGLVGRDEDTLKACSSLSRPHMIPSLRSRKLRDLSAEELDKWLALTAKSLSTRTLQGVHSCLNRAALLTWARSKSCARSRGTTCP